MKRLPIFGTFYENFRIRKKTSKNQFFRILLKDDIEKLHEKFKVQYQDSRAAVLSLGRDIPPVSGSIIWAKQIERQLETYLRRVEDVLGKGTVL